LPALFNHNKRTGRIPVRTAKLLLTAALAATMSATVGVASAQSKEGYWTSGAAGGQVWKNPYGLCWRAGYWTPAMAIAECDPDLVKKPAPPPPPPAKPAPPPPPKPKPEAKPPAKPKALRVVSTELFEFNRTTLTTEARAKLDKEVIARLKEFAVVRFINVHGHTDRLGSPQYNQKLSERRADAVRHYLVSKGADASKIETLGFGKTLPVKSCPDQRNRKALIECLAPNRRVEVEVLGTPR
jgi:OOP family OmpA-OmpF porin